MLSIQKINIFVEKFSVQLKLNLFLYVVDADAAAAQHPLSKPDVNYVGSMFICSRQFSWICELTVNELQCSEDKDDCLCCNCSLTLCRIWLKLLESISQLFTGKVFTFAVFYYPAGRIELPWCMKVAHIKTLRGKRCSSIKSLNAPKVFPHSKEQPQRSKRLRLRSTSAH